MWYGAVPGIDKPVSRLAQGTMAIGAADPDRSFALFDGVLELGCNTFDTAHVYGGGDSERTLGRWISDRGVRDEIVIIGKGGEPGQDRNRVTPFDLTADLHDSLARLRVDHIDLYLVHVDDPAVPVNPVVQTLTGHVQAGRVSAYGVSNWTHHRIEEACAYARAHDLTPPVASSVNLSLAVQAKRPWQGNLSISGDAGRAARDWYAARRMPLFAWSSLAGGFFSGRFTRDNHATFDGYFDRICAETYCYEENFTRLDRARHLAQEKGATIAQVALAYVLNQPLDVFALVGCGTAAEFASNLAALTLRLTAEETAWLERGIGTPGRDTTLP